MEDSKENKSWTWNREIQEDRQKLVEDPRLKSLCHECVSTWGDDGVSITTVLNCAVEAVKNTKNLEDTDQLKSFLDMNKTNQRLVIRKILHTKYKTGEYKLVDAPSKYRTGKKSKTQNYVFVKEVVGV